MSPLGVSEEEMEEDESSRMGKSAEEIAESRNDGITSGLQSS